MHIGTWDFVQAPTTRSFTWIPGKYFSFEVRMQLRVQGLNVGEVEVSFLKLSEIKSIRR